jgi:hypothetical protein
MNLCSSGAVVGNRRREEVVVCLCDDRTTKRGRPNREAEVWHDSAGPTAASVLA